MTLHRLFMSLMLAWTAVLALLYVSTFPEEGELAPRQGLSGQQAGPGERAPLPAKVRDVPTDRGTAAESLRHLA